MIVLRLLALAAGGLVLILPPLLTAGSTRPNLPAWIAVGGLAGLALVSLSFLYIAARGDRMRRSAQARTLGGLLLMIPAAAGITMLATRTDAALLWASAGLLSFTVLLFISFVYPAAPDRRQRPMRQRERSEPVLLVVQRHPSADRRGARF
ncbi:hypothetical protein ACI48D_09325 [Massilia sp. LXY-6]|uniref:hypothetical protein n=1 Tax=Massilia sp. LXY-6 TaxID=3379823 RepID=UPI003EE20A0F